MIDTCALKNKLLVSIFSGKLTTQKKSDSISSDLKESSNSLYELPFNWKWTSLKHVCSEAITDGTHQTPTYSISSDGIPFLSSKDVTLGHIDWTNIKYITKELHETLYKRIAPQIDDVLLAKNGTTGIAAIVENDRVFDIYVTLALLRPNKKYILPRYLLHVINSPVCKKQFNKRLIGIGVPNLHLNEINDTIIPLPPIEEQKCIIEKIESIFALLDEIDKAQEEYSKNQEILAKEIIQTGLEGKITKSNITLRTICNLCDVASIISGTSYAKNDIETEGIRIIRGGNIKNNQLVFNNDDVFISQNCKNDEKNIRKGDTIVVASTGSSIAIGKPAFVENNCSNTQIGAFLRIIRPNKKINAKFLNYFFNSELYRNYLDIFSKGMNINNLSSKDLLKMNINVPPMEEQRKIVEKLDAILPLCEI